MPPRELETPSERVLRLLRARIEAGEWRSGEALPSTVALADEYGVSQTVISRVMRTLADEGLVITRPRWGVFRA